MEKETEYAQREQERKDVLIPEIKSYKERIELM